MADARRGGFARIFSPALILLAITSIAMTLLITTAHAQPHPADDAAGQPDGDVQPINDSESAPLTESDRQAISQRVDQLAAPAYDVRQQAVMWLRTQPWTVRQLLIDRYQQSEDPEQRIHLKEILRHLWIQRRVRLYRPDDQKAALGVTHRGVVLADAEAGDEDRGEQVRSPGPRYAALVLRTLPGFPAHRHLEAGDLIVQVNGRNPPASRHTTVIQNWFVHVIENARSDAPVEFVLIRRGKTVRVSVTLASKAALQDFYQPSSGGLSEPFVSNLKRWERTWVEPEITTGPAVTVEPADLRGP